MNTATGSGIMCILDEYSRDCPCPMLAICRGEVGLCYRQVRNNWLGVLGPCLMEARAQ